MTLIELNEAIKNGTPLTDAFGNNVTASHLEISTSRVYCVTESGLGSFYEMSELSDPAKGDSEYAASVRWLRGDAESQRERENADIADRAINADLRLQRILKSGMDNADWAAEDEARDAEGEIARAEYKGNPGALLQTADF